MTITTRKVWVTIFVLGVIVPCCLAVLIFCLSCFFCSKGSWGPAFILIGFIQIEQLIILFAVVPLMACVALGGWVYSSLQKRRHKTEQE